MRIDLHAHTNHSDGTLTPAELAERAHAVGLSALAVTDHDTTAAVAEVRARAQDLGVEIFDGCEISTTLPTGTVHVLAYGFDPENAVFQGFLENIRIRRDERNWAILDRLATLDLPLEREEVLAHAVGSIVARPHIAMAMLERGYVDDLREAFSNYLHDKGPAYVQMKTPEPREAIDQTARAGGVTVLAHPGQMRLGSRRHYETVLGEMKEAGLTGVEVDHPSHDQGQRARFREMCEALDLVPSGGSDFHGAVKPHIELGSGDGSIEVFRETWERLIERRPVPRV